MSRRQLAYVVIAITSFAVSACGSSPTAPSHEENRIVVAGSGG